MKNLTLINQYDGITTRPIGFLLSLIQLMPTNGIYIMEGDLSVAKATETEARRIVYKSGMGDKSGQSHYAVLMAVGDHLVQIQHQTYNNDDDLMTHAIEKTNSYCPNALAEIRQTLVDFLYAKNKNRQVWNDAVEEFNQWLAKNPTIHPCYEVNMTDEERAEIQLMIDAA